MNQIVIGDCKGRKAHLDLDALLRSRMLIQANSGKGKSWLLRRLAEQMFGSVLICLLFACILVCAPSGEARNHRLFGFKWASDVITEARVVDGPLSELVKICHTAEQVSYNLRAVVYADGLDCSLSGEERVSMLSSYPSISFPTGQFLSDGTEPFYGTIQTFGGRYILSAAGKRGVQGRRKTEILDGEIYAPMLRFLTRNGSPVEPNPRPLTNDERFTRTIGGPTHLLPLVVGDDGVNDYYGECQDFHTKFPPFPNLFCALIGFAFIAGGWWGVRMGGTMKRLWWGLAFTLTGMGVFGFGINGVLLWSVCRHANTVPQKYFLTSTNYWGTVMGIEDTQMANILPAEKQIAVISALAEGSGIRQIERMTGVNRNTIMNLGVRIGKGCAALLDAKMRNLSCEHLQFDELWGFIGKKQRHLKPEDSPELGDVWTFCAIDGDTKLVPSFKVGKRDADTATAFVADVASRLRNRVQVSTDALNAYVYAMELGFGGDVDFAQIVKVFDSQADDAKIIRMDKTARTGNPNLDLATTSHAERLNGTTRLHMRRLTRLTYAFSKKLENFEAAVALHFAYYNFVKRHNTLRCTPAMAAGVEREQWTVKDLVGAAV